MKIKDLKTILEKFPDDFDVNVNQLVPDSSFYGVALKTFNIIDFDPSWSEKTMNINIEKI